MEPTRPERGDIVLVGGRVAAQYQICCVDHAVSPEILRLRLRRGLGVTGTPSFFLDGEKLEVQSFEELVQRMEQAVDA